MERNVPQGMVRYPRGSAVFFTVALVTSSGCRGTYESATRDDLGTAASVVARDEPPPTEPTLDASLKSYVAHALARSPELRASFERWKAATLRISRARRMPEPIIKYSYFVRSVETPVGPQQHKLSLMQTFPWPTALSAGSDAASSRARAAQWRFDAEALAVRRAVADAYWRLWLVHEEVIFPCFHGHHPYGNGGVYGTEEETKV